jgi:hypothetical protein
MHNIGKLPRDESFWQSVNTEQNKQFLLTSLFGLIQNSRPITEQDRIEYIAKAQMLVGLFDDAQGIYDSLEAEKISIKESQALADLID